MNRRMGLLVVSLWPARRWPLPPRCGRTRPPPTYLQTLGGPGHAAIYASGVDVDASGNVYVADTGNDQIKKYDPAGKLLWNVGVRGLKTAGNFDNPRDVAYLNGKVYVADLGNKRVQVLDAATGAAAIGVADELPLHDRHLGRRGRQRQPDHPGHRGRAQPDPHLHAHRHASSARSAAAWPAPARAS